MSKIKLKTKPAFKKKFNDKFDGRREKSPNEIRYKRHTVSFNMVICV